MKKTVILSATTYASVVASLVIGGFVFGVVHAKGCDWSVLGVVGRVFIGLVFAVLTPMFYGFPPRNEGGVGDPFNAWPYVGPVMVVLLPLALARVHAQLKRRVARSGPAQQPAAQLRSEGAPSDRV